MATEMAEVSNRVNFGSWVGRLTCPEKSGQREYPMISGLVRKKRYGIQCPENIGPAFTCSHGKSPQGMMVPARFGVVKTAAVIDTAAQVTIMSSNLREKLRLKPGSHDETVLLRNAERDSTMQGVVWKHVGFQLSGRKYVLVAKHLNKCQMTTHNARYWVCGYCIYDFPTLNRFYLFLYIKKKIPPVAKFCSSSIDLCQQSHHAWYWVSRDNNYGFPTLNSFFLFQYRKAAPNEQLCSWRT